MVVHRQKESHGDRPNSQGLGSGQACGRERADCSVQKVERGAVPGFVSGVDDSARGLGRV